MEKNQSLSTKSSLTSIKEASFARRVLALIMDAIFFVFTFAFLATVVMTPAANGIFKYSDIQTKALNYQIYSKLYVVEGIDENGQTFIVDMNENPEFKATKTSISALSGYENEDINFYLARVKYYYLNYKTGENIIVPEGYNIEDYRAPNYDKFITLDNGDTKLAKDVYNEDWFNANFGGITDIKELKNKIAETAMSDFFYQPYYQDLQKSIRNAQLFILLSSYIISFSIFYILVPCLYKNGETFAKKFLKIGFISKEGYSIKKRQIVIRQIAIFTYISLFVVISFLIDQSLSLATFAFLLFGVFVYLLFTFINKRKSSFIDLFAYVYLIDTNTSVWFSTPELEEEKEKEYNENMAKYRKGPVENKNIIQVGSTIINEEIRKEFEESKKTKKN